MKRRTKRKIKRFIRDSICSLALVAGMAAMILPEMAKPIETEIPVVEVAPGITVKANEVEDYFHEVEKEHQFVNVCSESRCDDANVSER